MDINAFQDSPFGSATIEPGNKWGFAYYLPKHIPRELELTTGLVTELSEADAALGHLRGLGMVVTDPSLLIGPYLRREALASSRIEGTQASLSEVFQSEIDDAAKTDDTAEVHRYLQATEQAFELAKNLPITQRLICQVHKTLMSGVRGEEKLPGEVRSSPVWIGSVGATPSTAAFVPPLPKHLGDLLADWERFVNDDGRHLPALVQAAIMHYQFETIHPFLDGNGRIGRLLINLLLMERERLEQPLLYLSSYFEAHREEYYSRLQAVRESGAMNEWLVFFMRAVQAQAKDAIRRSRRLVEIREEYMGAALQERSALPRLVDLILKNPFTSVRHAQLKLELSSEGARKLIKNAESRGWLASIGTRGRGGREYWLAPSIFEVMEAPMTHVERSQ